MSLIKRIKNWWYTFLAWLIISGVILLILSFGVFIYWLDHLRFEI